VGVAGTWVIGNHGLAGLVGFLCGGTRIRKDSDDLTLYLHALRSLVL